MIVYITKVARRVLKLDLFIFQKLTLGSYRKKHCILNVETLLIQFWETLTNNLITHYYYAK